MDSDDGIILLMIGSAVLAGMLPKWIPQLKAELISLNNWKTYLALFLLASPFLIFLAYNFYKLILKKRKIRGETENERHEIDKLLETEIDDLDIQKLAEHVRLLEEKSSSSISKETEAALIQDLNYSKRRQRELKFDERMDKKVEKDKALDKHLEELKRKDREMQDKARTERNEILEDLNRFEEHVFEKENLEDKQVKALIEEGFSQINEYSVRAKRVIPIIIKPDMTHTKTHSFLVWDVEKFLEDFKGVKDIQRHLTKGADITFTYQGKEFALEIETGILLKKKEQLGDKIKLLKRKYGKRWMVLVSKRDLLSKYRKFGLATQRSDFEKSFKKLLELYT